MGIHTKSLIDNDSNDVIGTVTGDMIGLVDLTEKVSLKYGIFVSAFKECNCVDHIVDRLNEYYGYRKFSAE